MSINWTNIKDRCPHAWAEFVEKYWLTFASGGTLIYRVGFSPFNPRDLFDFFDSKGVIINIKAWCKMSDTFECDWSFEIGRDGEMWTDDSEPYPSRTETESAAFTKAFEILNTRLEEGV